MPASPDFYEKRFGHAFTFASMKIKLNIITMKKSLVLGINLLMGLLLIFLASYTPAQQKTEIKITGIKSPRGKIIVQVFKDQLSYDDQKPCKRFVFDKQGMADGILPVKLELEPGIYGFTLVDDENGNGKIDKNFMGIPKEGFGFSNFFMEKMKKPTFEDFKVDLKTAPNIVLKVKYM